MKTKVLILGSTGMLGNAVTKYFLESGRYETVTTYRDSKVAFPGGVVFDAVRDPLERLPSGCAYVINCIGIIKPFMAQDPAAAIRLNALFPWMLAQWCETHGMKLIHITTDCVYSGRKGKYVESDLHDALDSYGKTKSLGECPEKAMVLRTSIIGEEIHKNASLISWAKSQKGKTVGGYATHLWNGVTTNEYARICDTIIQEGLYQKGLFHIFAKDDVSKLQMLHYFNQKFGLNLTIKEEKPQPIDRTLRTQMGLCAKLQIPTVWEMIERM